MVAETVIGRLPAAPILGAVFAGGESCRFGRDKALAMLAKLDGEPARRWLTLGESIARRRHMGR